MASRSDIPTTYSGKNPTFVENGQSESAKNYGMNPHAKGAKSGATTRAVGKGS